MVNNELKNQQSLEAWTIDCAFTEAKVRLACAAKAAQYNGVPNNTYALLELLNPPEEYPAFNEEAKGNVFVAYATIMAFQQDGMRISQHLYHVLLTDTDTI